MQHIGICLIDEKCNVLERLDTNFAPVVQALQSVQEYEKKYPHLIDIDPYGNTYFNVHQVLKVIDELEKLKQEKTSIAVSKEIGEVMEFIKKVEQHMFAKFVGD